MAISMPSITIPESANWDRIEFVTYPRLFPPKYGVECIIHRGYRGRRAMMKRDMLKMYEKAYLYEKLTLT